MRPCWAGCLVAVHAAICCLPCQHVSQFCMSQQCAWARSIASCTQRQPTCLPAMHSHPTPQTALLTNTLVCLPTGLGKTLIAAVVMHNFARWFPEVCRLAGFACGYACTCCTRHCLHWLAWPNYRAAHVPTTNLTPSRNLPLLCGLQGKVVFVAPTKPLVAQQVDACHSFMGMSKTGFCELTGGWVGW